jgi:hypothetical protein
MKLCYSPCNIPVEAVNIVSEGKTFPYLPTLSYVSIYVMPAITRIYFKSLILNVYAIKYK